MSVPKLGPQDAGWVITDKSNNNVICELFRDSKAINYLNTDNYNAIPTGQHLANLNKRISDN